MHIIVSGKIIGTWNVTNNEFIGDKEKIRKYYETNKNLQHAKLFNNAFNAMKEFIQ